MNKVAGAGLVDAKIDISAIDWYVLYYTPCTEQLAVLSKQILCRTPTDFTYVQLNGFLKDVHTQNLWTFQLGSQDGIIVCIWFFVRYQQRDRQNSAMENNGNFY